MGSHSACTLLTDGVSTVCGYTQVRVLGGPDEYEPVFADAGLTFDTPLSDVSPSDLSWAAVADEAAPGGVMPPPFLSRDEVRLVAALEVTAAAAASQPDQAAAVG